jgi:hypothetical protein
MFCSLHVDCHLLLSNYSSRTGPAEMCLLGAEEFPREELGLGGDLETRCADLTELGNSSERDSSAGTTVDMKRFWTLWVDGSCCSSLCLAQSVAHTCMSRERDGLGVKSRTLCSHTLDKISE